MAEAPDPQAAIRAHLERVARHSAILDSRIEKLCYEYDMDPAPRREALAQGRPVAFYRAHGAHRILIHRINPEDLL